MIIKRTEKKKILREKPETLVTVTEKVLEDGIFKTIIKNVPQDDVDTRSEFVASDYSIDALMAAGAVDLLKETSKLSTSNFDNIENIESLLSRMPSIEEIENNLSKENDVNE